MTPSHVLLVTGPVGAGKSALIGELSDRLTARDIPHSSIDVDWLCQFHPRPADDPYGERVALRCLRAVWEEQRAACGATHLLLARVLERREHLEAYREVLGECDITVVRLRASVGELRRRLRERELGAGLEWHLTRAAELAEEMDLAAVEDVLVETDGRGVGEIADELLLRAGWMERTP